MIDTVSELLLSGIVRTTLCTTLAALVTLLLLPAFGIRSARIHRTAWVLVILQGWLLLPLTFSVAVPSLLPAKQRPDASVSSSDPSPIILMQAYSQAVEPSLWQRYGKQTTAAVWLLGTLAVPGFYFKRYYSLITRVPLGSVPESSEWDEEWRDLAGAFRSKRKIHFRVTNHVGPLLCFVPFVYLVLVPRILWASLTRADRIAILQHELAHLKNGDLWKNLGIRVLALPQWFNPLVWLAVRRFEEAGEWACDDAVVASSGSAGTGYAGTLLRVAGFSTNTPCGAVAASGGLLTRRITRLLSSSNKEVSHMKNLALPLLLLAIACGQAIRIEPVHAKEPVKPTATTTTRVAEPVIPTAISATRAEVLEGWREGPYVIEPPDIILVDLILNAKESDSWEVSRFFRSHEKVIDSIEKGVASFAGQACTSFRFLVRPDGNINLGNCGSVFIAGMTLDEAKEEITKRLVANSIKAEVFLEVIAYNSKVVYVITKSASGDNVARIPCHIGTTVLDALSCVENHEDIVQAHVMATYSSTGQPAERLVIDLKALHSKNNETANYELLPGDRIFVERKSSFGKKRVQTSGWKPPQEGLRY